MDMDVQDKLINVISNVAIPLSTPTWRDQLLKEIGDARIVLIGEATHGTREFYQTRADITRDLIEKKGFMAVAIEGDWPDVYQIHRYLQGKDNADETEKAFSTFTRFPTWMWRNNTVMTFLRWLRDWNDQQSAVKNKIGFYGLDLYSLYSSMHAVIDYLEKVDPPAAKIARSHYACFDHVSADPQEYGYLTSVGAKKTCIKEASLQLSALQKKSYDYIKNDGLFAFDEYFYASQNARVVKNAENYYRAMFEGPVDSWNIRDKHMFETLALLADHLQKRNGNPAKIVVWAHNSHVGDAKATEMGNRGELNLGELTRGTFGNDAFNIGFSTYSGTVTAATEWGGDAERKAVNPGLPGSYEDLFHQVEAKNFLLNLRDDKNLQHYLSINRLQRAIGVIYRPESERMSHYFFTHLPAQFNSIIHIDKTNAVA